MEENPVDYLEEEICPDCVHSREEVDNPLLMKLLHYKGLIEGGCPIGRHELLDSEWIAIGRIKVECERIAHEETKEKGDGENRS